MNALLAPAAPRKSRQALRELLENKNIKINKSSKGKINLAGSLGDALNKTQT